MFTSVQKHISSVDIIRRTDGRLTFLERFKSENQLHSCLPFNTIFAHLLFRRKLKGGRGTLERLSSKRKGTLNGLTLPYKLGGKA